MIFAKLPDSSDYLVVVQEHRQEVFAHPGAWLPWN